MREVRFNQCEEGVIKLKDGRILGFAEYGDTKGVPFFFLHGIPGSRYFFELAHTAGVSLGVRVIAPERPGFGNSDFQTDRRLTDWVKDIRELADFMGIVRFVVVGVSGGGPYALACGHELLDRVERVGIVSSLGPLDHSLIQGRITGGQRVARWLFRDLPLFVPAVAAIVALFMKRAPALLMSLAMRLPEPGREILQEPEIRSSVIRGLGEAFRNGGRGVAHDVRLLTRDWGFPLEGVRVPVYLWHGVQDFDVPVLLARAVAASLPEVRAEFIEGAGHTWILTHFHTVMETLLERVD